MDEELLAEFLIESNENLAAIEQQLMDLEANPTDSQLLDAIFRSIHTIKGTCGFLSLVRLEKVAHAGENLLGKIRSTKYPVTEDVVSLLLECADAIKEIIAGIESAGAEPDVDYGGLITRLQAAERLVDTLGPQGSADAADKQEASDAAEPEVQAEPEEKAAAAAVAEPVAKAKPEAKPEDATEQLAEKPAEKAAASPTVQPEAESKPKVEVRQEQLPAKPATEMAAASQPAATTAVKPKSGGTIRVDVDLLDSLMNQVGELVLTRNRLIQMINASGSTEFMRIGRDIDHITEHLQNQLLQTRMQPISTIWNNVPRVVRDIGKQLNKKIRVVMVGEETELDRTILAALKDPLTHIIRNSCDHGIELPEARLADGKKEEGTLSLSAGQESGQIIIQIRDDGGGIDAARVKEKAVRMGLLTEEQAAVMPDRSALQLIFNPGLSTAKQVSNLSGRGVGMDVVKTEIEKVGGSVDIQSDVGKGTTLRIRIPLTLAIIPTLIVGFGRHRFAIPQMSVNELISAPAASPDWCMIGGRPFFRLRGNLLPVLQLNEALGLNEQARDNGNVVVINLGERQFGIQVDEIFGAEEIVVKPLGIHFQHLGCYGGCSILGDGHVIPIFDCNGLSQKLEVSQEAEAEIRLRQEELVEEEHELQHTLVFLHGKRRFAIPMALVERLECLPAESIEQSGTGEILQYRGDVISVVRWHEMIGESERSAGEEVFAIILSDGVKRMALLVEELGDILEVPLEIKKASASPLFVGTAVIQGQATEVADVFEIIKQVDPNWFTNSRRQGGKESRPRILFVEDAPFFRNLVIPVLEAMRFEIRTASDGEQACAILEEYTPDLILTDIEMPRMDGYALVDWVQNQSHLTDVPVVALTATPPDQDTARRAAFSDVLVKFDRETLVDHLKRIMGERGTDRIVSIDADVVGSLAH